MSVIGRGVIRLVRGIAWLWQACGCVLANGVRRLSKGSWADYVLFELSGPLLERTPQRPRFFNILSRGKPALTVESLHYALRRIAEDPDVRGVVILVKGAQISLAQAQSLADLFVMGDTHVGLQARLMSQALRKMTSNIKQSNTLVIFINQIRMKIGVMFGSPETTSGGQALKFFSSVRLDIRRISQIKRGDEVVGNQTRVKVQKNKVAPPFRQAEFEILYGEGIHKNGEILDLGVQEDLIEKSGTWFSYKGERIGQGRKNASDWLNHHEDVRDQLEQEIRVRLLPKKDQASDDVGAANEESAVDLEEA